MGEITGITWTDHTFNPWVGCTKVSAGCTHCYAESLMDKRLGKVQWGPQGVRVRTSPDNWKQPLKWNRKAEKADVRRKVFCASLADVFEDHLSIDSQWRTDLFYLIHETPSLDWLLLTKRIENVLGMVPGLWLEDGFPRNVWIGTTVEDQSAADKRIPELIKIPAKVRFLSVEPMIGPVDIYKQTGYNDELFARYGKNPISWVICGGESGAGARPMAEKWARDLRDDCLLTNVPFFFKQWGSVGGDQTLHHGGDFLDGHQYHEFPEA
jgi:protein gp37